MPEGAALVDIVIEEPRWTAVGLEAFAEAAARAALVALGRDPDRHEISLLACDDARIAALNAEFRGKLQPTNVLSWPAFDGAIPEPDDAPLFLGDLALAYETCAREAAEQGVETSRHAAHLVVHGVLHLAGYDHRTDPEAEAMEAIETNVLATLGIPDPYLK